MKIDGKYRLRDHGPATRPLRRELDALGLTMADSSAPLCTSSEPWRNEQESPADDEDLAYTKELSCDDGGSSIGFIKTSMEIPPFADMVPTVIAASFTLQNLAPGVTAGLITEAVMHLWQKMQKWFQFSESSDYGADNRISITLGAADTPERI